MIPIEKIVAKFEQLDEFLSILRGMRSSPLDKFLKGKILIDVLDIMGGAERNLLQLRKELELRGHTVTICALKCGGLSRSMQLEGLRVIELDLTRIYDFKALRSVLKLTKLIKKKAISLLMSYHESSDFLSLFVGLLTRIPVLSNRRDMGFKLKRKHIWAYRVANLCFERIIANSTAVKRVIVEMQWATPSKVLVIPNGVGGLSVPAEIYRIPEIVKGEEGCLYVCCLANIRPIKGQEYLIEAASLVSKRFPLVRFLLVGREDTDAAYSTTLREKVKKLGLEKKVHFVGALPHDQVQSFLSFMDISVLPSLSEGMSNTLLESMAAGKPVVATAVGGNPEVLANGRAGLLVPPADPEALADAINRLLNSPDIRREMGRSGRLRVESEYGVSKMVDRYERLFMEIHKSRWGLS